MSGTSLHHWNDQIQRGTARCLRLEYDITAAVTCSPVPQSSFVLKTFGAIASQAVIDAFLDSADEVLVAAFDATAMGADCFGGIVDMCGQVLTCTSMVARCYSASNTVVTRQCKASSALTASTLATEVCATEEGNLAFRVDFGNTPDFDALTAGTIVIEIYYISK
jgi:hypothetical protein